MDEIKEVLKEENTSLSDNEESELKENFKISLHTQWTSSTDDERQAVLDLAVDLEEELQKDEGTVFCRIETSEKYANYMDEASYMRPHSAMSTQSTRSAARSLSQDAADLSRTPDSISSSTRNLRLKVEDNGNESRPASSQSMVSPPPGPSPVELKNEVPLSMSPQLQEEPQEEPQEDPQEDRSLLPTSPPPQSPAKVLLKLQDHESVPEHSFVLNDNYNPEEHHPTDESQPHTPSPTLPDWLTQDIEVHEEMDNSLPPATPTATIQGTIQANRPTTPTATIHVTIPANSLPLYTMPTITRTIQTTIHKNMEDANMLERPKMVVPVPMPAIPEENTWEKKADEFFGNVLPSKNEPSGVYQLQIVRDGNFWRFESPYEYETRDIFEWGEFPPSKSIRSSQASASSDSEDVNSLPPLNQGRLSTQRAQ